MDSNDKLPRAARQWAVGFSINGYGYLGTGLAQSGDENDFWRFTPPDIGINEINPTNQISVFPNPASNNITIENKQQAIIEISNVEGQIIKTIAANNNKMNIDISTLSKGMYYIKVKGQNDVVVEKFVKE